MKKLLLVLAMVGLLVSTSLAVEGQWNFTGAGWSMVSGQNSNVVPMVSTGFYTTAIGGTVLIVQAGYQAEIIEDNPQIDMFSFGPMYGAPIFKGKLVPMAGVGILRVDDTTDDLPPINYFDFSAGATYFPNGFKKSTFGFSGAIRYVHGLGKVVAIGGLTILVR